MTHTTWKIDTTYGAMLMITDQNECPIAVDELAFIQDEIDLSYIVQGLAKALAKAEGKQC